MNFIIFVVSNNKLGECVIMVIYHTLETSIKESNYVPKITSPNGDGKSRGSARRSIVFVAVINELPFRHTIYSYSSCLQVPIG